MSYTRTAPAGLIAAGFQTLTLSNSTALGINSTVQATGANAFMFSVETNNARVRFDSTAPALTTGILIVKDNDYLFEGIDVTQLKFQRVTGTCKVSIQAFTRPGG